MTRPSAQNATIRIRPGSGMRWRLMTSGATGLAIAAMLVAPHHASAQLSPTQSFQGTGTVASGSAAIAQSGTVDTVRITTPEAVINWRPNDTSGTGSINFLPSGRRVQFLGDADFTVFNRIIPVNGAGTPVSRLIELNGQIDSFVLGQQGGNVWFYSPGGILVGGTGVFNVGSLILSTRDIDTTGGLFDPDGTIRFGGSALTTPGTITLANGARINADVSALPGSSYIALVAPRIEQAGTIRANGAVALVAAETVDIRVNAGLFDIFVTTGSDDPNGIVHTGSTGGPTDSSIDFESRAYLVAIPKTQAMTMLLSGTIGFQTNLTAGIDATGGIILSAGNNIGGGEDAGDAGATGRASMFIADTLFWNNVNGVATNDIVGRPTRHCAPNCIDTFNAGQIGFYRGGTLSAVNRVDLSVGQAQRIFAIGDLSLLAAAPGTGGTVNLTIDAAAAAPGFFGNGEISVTNRLLMDASAFGQSLVNNGAATGGNATLSATLGRIRAGQIDIRASGFGGRNAVNVGQTGQGGTARALANAGGTIESTFGAIDIEANGFGGQDAEGIPIDFGGNGLGGNASLTVTGGTAIASQGLVVSARGTGGIGRRISGNGTGGTARIDVNGPSSILTSGFVSISAGARGGGSGFLGNFGFVASADAGDGRGGTAAISITDNNGLANIGFLQIEADAEGGNSTQPGATAVAAGDGRGGTTSVTLTRSTFTPSTVIASATGSGGDANGALSNGGNGFGGAVTLDALNATLIADSSIRLLAEGNGGVGANMSGDGSGGSAALSVDAASSLRAPLLALDASGLGGGAFTASASFAPDTLIGGDGRGGLVEFTTAGDIEVTTLDLVARAIGGDASPPTSATGLPEGGSALGGRIELNVTGGAITADTVQGNAAAIAGASGTNAGRTGFANGGQVIGNISNSTWNIANGLSLISTATARLGGGGRLAGLFGGQVIVGAIASDFTVGGAGVLFDASAGSVTTTPAQAGVGVVDGGFVTFTLASTQLGTPSLTLAAAARGARNGGSTASGNVDGGTAELRVNADGSVTVADTLRLDASATGGDAFDGAVAAGGTARILAINGNNAATASISAASTEIDVRAVSGGLFGAASVADARGGSVTIEAGGGEPTLLTLGQLFVDASASNASTAVLPAGYTGPIGGDASGGFVQINVFSNGTLELDDSQIFAEGRASAGGTGSGGTLRLEIDGSANATINLFDVSLLGRGGTGIGTRSGGLGRGGTATVLLSGGNADFNTFEIAAEGIGGDGADGFIAVAGERQPGNGGNGEGGSIDFTATGTTFNSGSVTLTADGRGGDGGDFDPTSQSDYYNPGSGGIGTGGTVTASLAAGIVNSDDFQLYARGRGGDGGDITGTGAGNLTLRGGGPAAPAGGAGNGGTATFRIGGATFNFAPLIDASAIGGAGGTALAGAQGGNALGGTAEAIIDNVDGGVVNVSLRSNASGGAGGDALHGAGGSAGFGTGGRASVSTTGTNARATVSSTLFEANGTGGAGGNGAVSSAFAAVTAGFDGGRGGEGTGGEVAITSAGGEILLNAASGFVVNGLAGNGGSGANNPGSGLVATSGGNGGNGGNGTGGIISLTANGGSLGSATAGTTALSAGASPGTGGAGGTGTVVGMAGGNGFAGTQGFAFGGTVRLVATSAANSRVSFDGLTINAGGDIAGRIELIDDSDGAGLDLGAVSILAQGATLTSGNIATGGSGVYLRSDLGAMQLDNLTITTGGAVQFDAIGTGGFAATGTIDIGTTGDITVNHASRPTGTRTIDANLFQATGGRFTAGTGSLIRSSNLILLNSGTDIAFDQLESGAGPIEAFASGFVTGDTVTSTTGNVTIDGGFGVNVGSVDSAGSTILQSNGVAAVGNLVSRSGSATVQGNGVTIGGGSTATTLTVRGGTGDAVIGSFTSGGTSDIAANRDIRIASLTTTGGGTSDALVNAGRDVLLGSINSSGNLAIAARNLGLAGTTPSSLIAAGAISVNATGTVDFGSANGQSLIVSAPGAVTFGSVTTGSATTINGASITGGSLTTTNGNVLLNGPGGVNLASANIGGILALTAGSGAVTLGTAVASADIRLTARDGINVTSARTTDTGPGSTGNPADIIITTSGTVSAGTLNAAENLFIDANALTGASSALTAGNQLGIMTAGSATFGTANASGMAVNAGGSVTFGQAETDQNLSMVAAGTVSGNRATSRAGNVSLRSTGANVAVANIDAGLDAILNAANGVVLFDQILANRLVAIDATQITGTSLTSPGSVSLIGPTGVDIGLLHAGGAVTLAAANGTVRVADLRGPAIDARGRAIDLTTTGTSGITVARATAGNVLVRGDAGNLSVGDAEASGNIDIRVANGTLTAGRLVGTNILVDGGLGITLSGSQTASGLLDIRSRRAATVNGTAVGATIAVNSGDIVIGSNGRIGQIGTTTQLTLTNGQSSVRTFVGGNDTTAGYSLSAAEMLRLFANNIGIVAPQVVSSSSTAAAPTAVIGLTRQPDLTIDSFTVNGGSGPGGNLGANGTLRIETPGFARVIGAAQLANAAPGNRLTLVGLQSLEVILGQGSVRVTNGGALAGTLELVSQDVVVATAAAITDIAAAGGNLSAIEDRLAVNDGFASDAGAISADAIRITASGVYIQNTGTGSRFAERRGYTAGAGGMTINFIQSPVLPGPANGVLVINGRVSDGAGGFLTGLDAFPTVTVAGVVLQRANQIVNGLIPGSTLNGCSILSAGTCREVIFNFPEPVNPLINEDDEESEQAGGEFDPPGVLVELRDIDPLPNEPLVDDPVTGAGNDDLWVPLPE